MVIGSDRVFTFLDTCFSRTHCEIGRNAELFASCWTRSLNCDFSKNNVHVKPTLAALKHLPSESISPNFNSNSNHVPIPWHRVINAKGAISSRGPGTDGARMQRDRLVNEGVEVLERAGEFRVDFGRFGWFPESVGDV